MAATSMSVSLVCTKLFRQTHHRDSERCTSTLLRHATEVIDSRHRGRLPVFGDRRNQADVRHA